ncbi:OmpA family protein [Nannocystis exedens]|uniref:OmpA family protein n=1 Tax=Nannocystis exedens TaxID=54 RepID=UPI002108ED02|nr:OmpA family protein [Nannocystis exedens]
MLFRENAGQFGSTIGAGWNNEHDLSSEHRLRLRQRRGDRRIRDQLQRFSDQLQNQPHFQLQIEGNTDPRGSAEYNLALGLRRARAVQECFNRLDCLSRR